MSTALRPWWTSPRRPAWPMWSSGARRRSRIPSSCGARRPAGQARPGGWQDVTAVAFRDEVIPLAKGLIAAGIQPGDRVAIMSRTRYEWTLLDYAIWTAGAVTVPIYETSSAEQVEWILSRLRRAGGVRRDRRATSAMIEFGPRAAARPGDVLADRGRRRPRRVAAGTHRAAAGSPRTSMPRRAAGAWPPATWRRSSTPRAPPAAPRAASSPTATCSPSVNDGHDRARPTCSAADSSTLLFLPLAHVFARIIQVGCV